MGAFLLTCTVIPGFSQDDDSSRTQTSDVQGEIENGPVGSGLSVQLLSMDGNLDPPEVEVSGTTFEIDSVPLGEYRLRVTDPMGNVLHEEFVTVSGGNNLMVVRMPEPTPPQGRGGIVSVRELSRKVPGKARKELGKAEEALKKGKVQESAGHLQKAIQACPDFWEAHNNLGVCYLRLNQADKALEEFQKASQLNPEATQVSTNLSAVLLGMHHYGDAETAARRALKSDPLSDLARLLLGLSLEGQDRGDDEALVDLQRVEVRYPQARLAAAGILAKQGHMGQAANELKSYLRSPSAILDRQKVEAWLARLQQVLKTNAQPAQRN